MFFGKGVFFGFVCERMCIGKMIDEFMLVVMISKFYLYDFFYNFFKF